MSVALILKLVESNDEYEDDMSSKYEMVHDCIKVLELVKLPIMQINLPSLAIIIPHYNMKIPF